MSAGLPRVAVVGRQNVGKSTLLNRLYGHREAIAAEEPGVTRDRVEVEASWRGRDFVLIDTGGYVRRAKGIEALVSEQAKRASESADVVVLVCDSNTGIQEEDADLAKRLRRLKVPVLVAANKIDNERQEANAAGFHKLGLGEPMPLSALHGRGSGELLDRIIALLPETPREEEEPETEPRFAIVGRPNVGKSSLFNRLVGEERSVVYEEAGTTRDAVDAVVTWNGDRVRFVDTAGFRRPSKTKGVEYYGLVRATKAIERAHVALLVLDAPDGFTSEDKKIAARVLEAGRGLAVVANKWDLVERKADTLRDLSEALSKFAGAQVLRTSAHTGVGVDKVPPALVRLHERWGRRVPTVKVNEVLEAAQGERPAPHTAGRYRYGTQVAAGPPLFVLFGGRAPDARYHRYLENRFRKEFDLRGVPVRLKFKPRHRGKDRE